MKFKLLTYNIHKGFSTGNRTFVLKQIKESIRQVHADLVCIQEAVGDHRRFSESVKDWPSLSQFEYLAEDTWSHVAYGKNKVHAHGHHGNAILSKHPISFWENEDISFGTLERRGMLHTIIEHPHGKTPLHVFSVHLGLFENDRTKQLMSLSRRIKKLIPPEDALVIAGDFNDWKQTASAILTNEIGTKEAFFDLKGHPAYTFPSWFPVLSLDRIYYRNLRCNHASVLKGGIWSKLSDHLPLLGEFEW